MNRSERPRPFRFFRNQSPFALVWVAACLFSQGALGATSWSSSSSWSSGAAAEPVSTSKKALAADSNKELSPFAPGSHNISLELGQVFLMGDLGKYSDSIGTQAHYTYGVSDLFGFDASLGYSSHADNKFSMLNVKTGLRMNLSWYDKIVPYGVFGVGFYKPSMLDESAPATATSNSVSALLFGIHLGPGMDLELSKNLFFGGALTFNSVFGTGKTFANGTPVNLGGTYATFFVHIGATF
jgi:hypothetical protein